MAAPRRSTPPKSARSGRQRTGTSRRDRAERTRSGTQRRPDARRSGGHPAAKKGRLWVKVLFMAGLGYLVVLGADLASSWDTSAAQDLWTKIVDRLLDNDVPTRDRTSPTPPPKAKPVVAKAAPANPPPSDELPRSERPAAAAPAKGPPRADLPAPSPEGYAKQSKSLDEVRKAEHSREELDDLVKRVTGQL